MLRFLHLSDLHLGWQPSFLDEKLASTVQKERDAVLTHAVTYVLESQQDIDLVIIAGDLFENHHPPQELVEKAIRELKRLSDGGLGVITVPGNHDEITYRDSVYRLEKERWPGLLVTNPMPDLVEQLEIKGQQVYIYSLAYTGGITVTNPPICDFPKVEAEGFHLGIFHGSYNWDAGDRSLPLDPKGLAKAGYDYVALGHFHSYQTYRIGSGIGVYPGAVAGKGLHDLGEGHFLLGEWEKSRGIRLEKVPVSIPIFQLQELDISEVQDLGELALLLEAYSNPEAMVRLELQGITGFPVDVHWLQKRAQGFFRYLEIINNSVFLSPAELEQRSRERTITGFFLTRMKEQLVQATTDEEKRLLNRALTRGLLALKGGKKVG